MGKAMSMLTRLEDFASGAGGPHSICESFPWWSVLFARNFQSISAGWGSWIEDCEKTADASYHGRWRNIYITDDRLDD